MKKYDLRKIMTRAWELVKTLKITIANGLKIAWGEAKMALEKTNVVIEHFYSYNFRRYSKPWVCEMTPNGRYDFSKYIGCYTVNDGDEGDLVVFNPIVGQVYGWGQKDYRGNNTKKNFCKWDGTQFVACDKLGN